jgi:hypothetical protein
MSRSQLSVLAFISLIVAASCASDDLKPPVDCEVEGPVIQVTEVGDSECNEQNGFVGVEASAGAGNYQYSLNGEPFQPDPLFSNLGAGSYTVTVKDDNGCETSVTLSINNSEGVNLTVSSTEAGCGASEGTITAIPEGGEPPYAYRIDGGSFQDEATFENLSQGVHTVVIQDQTGCESSQTARVNSGISFATDIQPIITSSCAINDCHNGNQFPDFRVFKNIKDNAANVKKLTGDGTMPQEGSITQAQIDKIACWVDDGAPQN